MTDTNELMVSLLRDIQARLARMEDGQRDVIRRLGRMEQGQTSIMVTQADEAVRLDRLAERVDRIERRLEIRD